MKEVTNLKLKHAFAVFLGLGFICAVLYYLCWLSFNAGFSAGQDQLTQQIQGMYKCALKLNITGLEALK